MRTLFKRFFKEEEGLELVEYAVMTALLIAAVVVAIQLLGQAVDTRFRDTEATVRTGTP